MRRQLDLLVPVKNRGSIVSSGLVTLMLYGVFMYVTL
jgi:hypothetical protein